MRLSTKCRYGTRAMIELAKHYTKGPVKRKDISRNQRISPSYLENILITLKSQRLVRTVRGAHGGFVLETSPDRISMLQIVGALEGSLVPADCVEHVERCTRSDNCMARKLWQNVYKAQIAVLKSITLQSLIDGIDTLESLDYCI